MKTIGMIGGMSWESTVPYYRIINETVRDKLGGLHSARCVLWSFDFQEIETLQHQVSAGRRHHAAWHQNRSGLLVARQTRPRQQRNAAAATEVAAQRKHE